MTRPAHPEEELAAKLAAMSDAELKRIVKEASRGTRAVGSGLSSRLGAMGVGLAADLELSKRARQRIRRAHGLPEEE